MKNENAYVFPLFRQINNLSDRKLQYIFFEKFTLIAKYQCQAVNNFIRLDID